MEPLSAPVESVLDEKAVRSALKEAKGNKRKAAEILGVHRSTLYRLLKSDE